jgi:hypothetical protein
MLKRSNLVDEEEIIISYTTLDSSLDTLSITSDKVYINLIPSYSNSNNSNKSLRKSKIYGPYSKKFLMETYDYFYCKFTSNMRDNTDGSYDNPCIIIGDFDPIMLDDVLKASIIKSKRLYDKINVLENILDFLCPRHYSKTYFLNNKYINTLHPVEIVNNSFNFDLTKTHPSTIFIFIYNKEPCSVNKFECDVLRYIKVLQYDKDDCFVFNPDTNQDLDQNSNNETNIPVIELNYFDLSVMGDFCLLQLTSMFTILRLKVYPLSRNRALTRVNVSFDNPNIDLKNFNIYYQYDYNLEIKLINDPDSNRYESNHIIDKDRFELIEPIYRDPSYDRTDSFRIEFNNTTVCTPIFTFFMLNHISIKFFIKQEDIKFWHINPFKSVEIFANQFYYKTDESCDDFNRIGSGLQKFRSNWYYYRMKVHNKVSDHFRPNYGNRPNSVYIRFTFVYPLNAIMHYNKNNH